MISRTKIKFRTGKKTNPSIKETIALALKNSAWHKVAQRLSASTRDYVSVNLSQLDSITKNGETVVVLGKVLGSGNITKKIRVCALGFSSSAIEKMKKTKSESVSVMDEIKINPKAESIKLI